MSEDKLSIDTFIAHKWENGIFIKKDGDGFKTREDKCLLCGLRRTYIKSMRGRFPMTFKSSYWRGNIIFHPEDEPQCWGGPNPV